MKQKNLSGLEKAIMDASDYVSKEFSLDLERSKLKQYNTLQWEEFCKVNEFEAKSTGLYIPKTNIAYVQDSPLIIPDALHELFGHGIFCEHSSIGKELVKLEQKGEDSRKYLFDIDESKTTGLARRNIDDYEGFATWLEALLCKETGNEQLWQSKKERLPEGRIRLLEHFQKYEQEMTRFGLLAQMGFPKKYSNEDIVSVVKKLYGQNFENIDSIILYGSRKPESDIDLFIISKNRSGNFFNGWLDIYEMNKDDFHAAAKKMDISVTDPILTGESIYGNKKVLEDMQKKILRAPITREAITYNQNMSEYQRSFIEKTSGREKNIAANYAESYRLNAELLSQGVKILMLKNLEEKTNFKKIR